MAYQVHIITEERYAKIYGKSNLSNSQYFPIYVYSHVAFLNFNRDFNSAQAIVFCERRRGTGAVRDINSALKEDTASIGIVRSSYARFRGRDPDFQNERLSVHPYSGKLRNSRRFQRIRRLAAQAVFTRLECTNSSVLSRLQHRGYRKVLTQWIPHSWPVACSSAAYSSACLCLCARTENSFWKT